MKWPFRFFVFIAAFLLGIFAYSITLPNGLSNCVVDIGHDEAFLYERPTIAPRSHEIMVMYAGLKHNSTDNEPMLRFVISNGLNQQITYSAQIPTNPHAILTANGKELPQVIGCGNGIESYYIPPGSVTEVYVHPGQFLERPRKSDDITAGFYLNSPSSGTSEVYTSEKFRLPEEFRTAMNSFRD